MYIIDNNKLKKPQQDCPVCSNYFIFGNTDLVETTTQDSEYRTYIKNFNTYTHENGTVCKLQFHFQETYAK